MLLPDADVTVITLVELMNPIQHALPQLSSSAGSDCFTCNTSASPSKSFIVLKRAAGEACDIRWKVFLFLFREHNPA